MARGGLDFEGIGYRGVSYKANAALVSMVAVSGVVAVEGKAVALTGYEEVGFGSAGNKLLGRLDKYESDDNVTVQEHGYASMPGVSGNLPTYDAFLVVDGNGAVMPSAGAVGPARAISVDSTNKTVMVLIG